MTLALPSVAELRPYPIKPYPARPLPPPSECLVQFNGTEIPVKYTINRRDEVFVQLIQINNTWVDPVVFGFTASSLRVIENECLAIDKASAEEWQE